MEFSIRSKDDGSKDLYMDDKFVRNGTQEELFAALQSFVERVMNEKDTSHKESTQK